MLSVAEFVAQSCTLLFRRFSICRLPPDQRRRNISSRLQNANLRYSPDAESGRFALMEICATSARALNTYRRPRRPQLSSRRWITRIPCPIARKLGRGTVPPEESATEQRDSVYSIDADPLTNEHPGKMSLGVPDRPGEERGQTRLSRWIGSRSARRPSARRERLSRGAR